ncbi:50S ribosomal protein L24 [Mesomycoplasma neurolyticum]|uniref:Large ribosomal subunit protein uL24 n=1 Tax=Mesomycoplasma neurolyticum TaxID=2120 RepID=A0A449A694_9BACT|nr:50S ribosomal protein L24 [Mesomycoplasma neurolyticum]VEU59737.1 50S ribosomal protein L24 [Mesomycoplasma neurolyticum]
MKIYKNDQVVVISGKDKGKIGQVLQVFPKKQQVIVKDVNKITKHHKPSQTRSEGGIEIYEGPIHVSNVALLIKKESKGKKAQFSKIGYRFTKDNKKVRFAKKTNKDL